MLETVKAIQAQQLYKVQPVSLYETNGRQQDNRQQALLGGFNMTTGKSYNPFYPSVENSPILGRSLDLLG